MQKTITIPYSYQTNSLYILFCFIKLMAYHPIFLLDESYTYSSIVRITTIIPRLKYVNFFLVSSFSYNLGRLFLILTSKYIRVISIFREKKNEKIVLIFFLTINKLASSIFRHHFIYLQKVNHK